MTTSNERHPFTVDGHIDAIFYALAHGGAHRFFADEPGAQVSLPALRRGGVDAAFLAIFGQGELAAVHDPEAAAAETDALMAGYAAWCAPGTSVRAVRSAADLEAIEVAAAGATPAAPAPFGAVIHCEGARGIRDPDHLHALHAQGLRSVGLTWNGRNAYAAGAECDPDLGLTDAGRVLVRELEALHMVLDAAHLNRQGFADLLATARGPIVVTHTACAALLPHPRCITDDQIRAVAERDGVIGVFFVNKFLAPPGAPVTIDTVIDHYDHLVAVGGIEHVALGTDFGGIDSGLPLGLTVPDDLPALFAGLRRRGYAETDITALRGGNYRRVLGRVLG